MKTKLFVVLSVLALVSLLVASCGTLPVAAPTTALRPTLPPRATTGILPRTPTSLPPLGTLPQRAATSTETPTLSPSHAEPAVEWTKTFGTPDAPQLAKKVRQTSDGGYILVGGATRPGATRSGSHYAYLVKTDSSGNLQWEKTLGDGTDDWGFDVQQTSDGGYIIAGVHNGSGDDHDDRDLTRNSEVYLIKTDATGRVQWEKKFGGDKADKALRVQQTADGGYIIIGVTASFGAGHWDVYLLKTDSSGNLEWQKTFGTKGEDWGQAVLQTSDGGYILAGQTQVGEGKIMPNGKPMTIFNAYVVRTDSAGKLIWEKTFGGQKNNVKGRAIQSTADGNYIIAGTTDTGGKGNNDFYLLKIDPQGNMLWEKWITKPVTQDNCWDIDVTADGGYILAGETMKGRFGNNDIDVFVVRTDADGNVLWTKVIGKASTRINEWARGVERTSDGGYILAGMTTSADGNKDAFLIKLAKEQNLLKESQRLDIHQMANRNIFGNMLKLRNPVIDSDNRRLYFSAIKSTSIGVIDLDKDELIETFDIGMTGGVLLLDPKTKDLYMVLRAGNMFYYKIDLKDKSAKKVFSLPPYLSLPRPKEGFSQTYNGYTYKDTGHPFKVGYLQNENAAYGIIEVKDSSGRIVDKIKHGPNGLYFAIDPKTGKLYATNTIGLVIVGTVVNKNKNKNLSESSPAPKSTQSSVQTNVFQNKDSAVIASNKFLIGIEYAVDGQDATAFAALDISAVKPFPEAINWSKMQPKLGAPIDFSIADKFVKEYQNTGFREIIFGLRTLSRADDNKATYGKDRPVPKPEYVDEYANWVKNFVERYDKDGKDDMPGLKYPVRYYEIEVEFSAYTPELVEEYLEKLKIAYKAAHEAYPDVVVAHSAFLALTAFDSNPSSADYEKAFAAMYIPDKHHGLKDMRKVLDHPELFDRLNFHELGDPLMIERTVAWLKYETAKRGYSKPIIISDTAATPFISYGRATSCRGPALGIVVFPAKESDRCRLADYFNKILDNDAKTVAWKNWYLAGDIVKKVVIAAASGVELIDTAFTYDLPILNTKLGFASAGNAGFGGVVSGKFNFLTKKYTITEHRPGFYALKQAAEKLNDVRSITRESSDADVRLYKIETGDGAFWVGWLHPDYLVLPGDPEPKKIVSLPLGSGAIITDMATSIDVPKTQSITPSGAVTNVTLTTAPVYITKTTK